MNEYNNSLKLNNIPHQSYIIRDKNAEINGTINRINDNNDAIDNNKSNTYSIKNNDKKQRIDYTLFADDASLDIPKIEYIQNKLDLYNISYKINGLYNGKSLLIT